MVKKKVKKGNPNMFWFSKDQPYKMAMACKSIQPFFTSQQIAGLTGLPKDHVQKTLSVWKDRGLIESIGLGKKDGPQQKAFYLYSITKSFEKHLKVAQAKRPAEQIKQLESATLTAPVIAHLRVIAKNFQELEKIIG